ncbi:MAG: tRNA (pseudouridine(54)-N(1))-methyltransferase TrmY [Methanomicrobiaceae archaeon]|nr:tRNA (pseudouridine(54)-N(1))-methyltransferase TrmY [Methanomicrobiaceae archaeon]
MIRFAVIGHHAATSGAFSLNDLPGGAGRLDVLCRCINSALFLSHNLRRDVECALVLLGEPDPPRTIVFVGSEVRSLHPDERSCGSMVKKALSIPCGSELRESTPGVHVRRGDLARLLAEESYAVLDENGEDIRTLPALPAGYILSDHKNFTESERQLLQGLPRISVGPLALHADHVISIVLNEHDRRNR